MVWSNVKGLLVALFCVTLLLCLLDAKDFRYKRYTFRKKQRLVSILFDFLRFVDCFLGQHLPLFTKDIEASTDFRVIHGVHVSSFEIHV